MSKFLSILFAISILAQSVANLTTVGSFLLNRDHIARAFCVNKDRPELKCNGKCYLARKLRQAYEKEQAPLEPPLAVRVLPLTTPPVAEQIIRTVSVKMVWPPISPPLLFEAPLTGVFHPPRG